MSFNAKNLSLLGFFLLLLYDTTDDSSSKSKVSSFINLGFGLKLGHLNLVGLELGIRIELGLHFSSHT